MLSSKAATCSVKMKNKSMDLDHLMNDTTSPTSSIETLPFSSPLYISSSRARTANRAMKKPRSNTQDHMMIDRVEAPVCGSSEKKTAMPFRASPDSSHGDIMSTEAQYTSDNPMNHTRARATSERTASEALGEEARVLMQKIRDLRTLGIEDTDLPLPKICVVGDQSTGVSIHRL